MFRVVGERPGHSAGGKRGSVGRNPSPGSLLSPPSPQGRGLKSIMLPALPLGGSAEIHHVDSPLPGGEGVPQPA